MNIEEVVRFPCSEPVQAAALRPAPPEEALNALQGR